MTREQVKEAADASWGQGPKKPADPGIDAARLEWLLRCEAAIKSMAGQFVCPKTTPEQMVDMILGGEKS